MAEKTETGRIIRSLSGFYEVRLPQGVLTCKARGSETDALREYISGYSVKTAIRTMIA